MSIRKRFMTSTPEIVNCLVDHKARLIFRLGDGRKGARKG
ncbi:hypothetical protein ABEW05_008658 [Botrytis cinerea]